MKINELKEQTVEELESKLADVKKNVFNLKFQKATGQLENTRAIPNLKKDIAKIKTLIREKELKPGPEKDSIKEEKSKKVKKPAGKK